MNLRNLWICIYPSDLCHLRNLRFVCCLAWDTIRAENGDSPSGRRRRTWRGTVPIFGSCPATLCVELDDVFILQDAAALDALAVVARVLSVRTVPACFAATLEPGELEVLGEVSAEITCSIGDEASDGRRFAVSGRLLPLGHRLLPRSAYLRGLRVRGRKPSAVGRRRLHLCDDLVG